MLAEKNTTELANELKNAETFRQYLAENEEAFVSAGIVCPFCGKTLRRNVSYCTHCMHMIGGRRNLNEQKKKIRIPLRVFLCMIPVLLAVFMAFLISQTGEKNNQAAALPTEEEFRVLALGAVSMMDEKSKDLWFPETLTKAGEKAGYIVTEGKTSLSDEPIRAAFSKDRKRMFFEVSDIPYKDLDEAINILDSAFSAVYGYVPENLEELLMQEGVFQTADATDKALEIFVEIIGKSDSENGDQGQTVDNGLGAHELTVTLPIYASDHAEGLVARVYKAAKDETFDFIVCFETEA